MAPTALQPVNPTTVPDDEKETEAPWVVRKLVGSMTGRVVLSSYETLKATSTSVICLSPWGDSSPLLLPCIRFRDLVVHTAIAATGGTAAIAAPVMGPIADTTMATFGDTIAVEIGNVVAYDVGTKLANDLIADKTSKALIPIYSARLETTAVKTILITLKFKHTMSDAALGFFRSGTVHKDGDLFANVKDYLSIEKGWFNPYLFASSRRPVIPRSMKPDIIFCHGPFLLGDYRIAETLLAESASVIELCADPSPVSSGQGQSSGNHDCDPTDAPPALIAKSPMLKVSEFGHKVSSYWRRPTSQAPSVGGESTIHSEMSNPPTALESTTPPILTSPSALRRILVIVLGISPHRKLWTTSARPGESVLNYHLLNGCPALVLPAGSAHGSTPLVAWDTLTLKHIHTIGNEQGGTEGEAFQGVITCLFEYLSLCVDWDRVVVPDGMIQPTEMIERFKQKLVRDGLELVLSGAVKSRDSRAARTDLDLDRAGIAMFRFP